MLSLAGMALNTLKTGWGGSALMHAKRWRTQGVDARDGRPSGTFLATVCITATLIIGSSLTGVLTTVIGSCTTR